MRVRLTIFVLATFLLWSSLLAVSAHHCASKRQEIKISAEFVNKPMVADEDFIWKKSSYQPYTVFFNFAKAKIQSGRERLSTTGYFTQKSVKYFLLFRVLRN